MERVKIREQQNVLIQIVKKKKKQTCENECVCVYEFV